MTRVVSLFLPRWSTDRLRRKSDVGSLDDTAPLVLVGHDSRRRVIMALDDNAEALGLRLGMPVAKAQALAPDLRLMDANPAADAAGLQKLAHWALQRISPIVMADPPDGLVIDTTGADHLHGGEAVMLGAILQRFASSGVKARIALAQSWGAAHAAARFGEHSIEIIPDNKTASFLAALPLAALRLQKDMIVELHRLGFETIADVMNQPRAPLTLRFGPQIARRLDQAFGRLPEPITPYRVPEIIEARKVFGEPIGAAETIRRAIGKLVSQLCAELETRGMGARRLDLLIHRVDNARQALRVGAAQPIRDPQRLSRLLNDKIASIDPGFGIEIMELAAVIVEPLRERQPMVTLIDAANPDISDLVDVLANRIGESRLCRFTPVESDVPERSVAMIAALSPETGATWNGKWPRPTRLLARPEPIETMALLPDNPPVWFTWRGVRRRVRQADGPERIRGEWWKRDAEMATVRDYFQVEDDAGERYWIFRSGDGEHSESGSQRWFLHGVFG
ncbi:Y-family DNA polymerase [Brucella pseudogrignonensis]|uniref:Y-family DNA polymerase n=1 Tax=Brucella pseudogrignonensis TaxID=419475 RepID=UPI0038D0F297